MSQALGEQPFGSYEYMKKCLAEWFAANGEDFYWRGIHKLPEGWEKCITSDGTYFEYNTFYHSLTYFLRKESAFHIILVHLALILVVYVWNK